MSTMLRLVEFDLAGPPPLNEGRYLCRSADGEPRFVLGVRALAAPSATGRKRRKKGRPESANPEPARIAITRYAVAATDPVGDSGEAAAWLERTSRDPDATEHELGVAERLINRALHAQRAAIGDPAIADISADRALVRRLGIATGEEVAAGAWSDAVEIPHPGEHGGPVRRRIAEIGPQERVAAVLGGREEVPAAVSLLGRARADFDQGRWRDSALQLVIALDAVLAEIGDTVGERQLADLAELHGLREAVGRSASAALRADGVPDTDLIGSTLQVCERVVARRRIGTA